jgi:outer membrane protein
MINRRTHGSLTYLIKTLHQAMRARLDQRLRAVGLTLPQVATLVTLKRARAASSAELARAAFVSPQAMGELLAGLEASGLIRRAPDARNGRVQRATLTRAGLRRLERAGVAMARVEARSFSVLRPEERGVLRALLERCAAALAARRAWRSGLGVVATLLVAACPPPLGAQTVGVTLADAVRRALEVQPAVVQARGTVTDAEWQKRAADGAFLPTVTVSSSAFRQNTPSFVNGLQYSNPGTYQYSTGFAASLDLFTGFRRLAQYRNANATEDAADAGLVNQRYQVTLATQQLFFTALANEELVRVAQAQVQRTKEELQISVNKFLAGAATRSDTLTSTVDLGNAQLSLLQAQANLATAQAGLARQIGVDGPVRALPDSQLPGLPDTAGLRPAALERAPVVVQAAAQERAASAAVWQARAAYWPTLNASYTTSSQGFTAPWNGFTPGFTQHNLNQLRFSLSWTLFNGFQREQATAQSLVSADVARAQTLDTRRQTGAQLTQYLAALFTAYAQIGITGANVTAAAEALRVQQERYRLGAATLLDLLTAEANLTQAQVNQVQARYGYLTARAQVEALVGRPL